MAFNQAGKMSVGGDSYGSPKDRTSPGRKAKRLAKRMTKKPCKPVARSRGFAP